MSGRGGRSGGGGGGRVGGGRGPPDAGRGQQASRGGGGPGRGGAGGYNAPPQSVAAAPQPSRPEPAASLSHEIEQKLTLKASSSQAPQTQGPPAAANPPPVQPELPPASSKAVRYPQRPGFGSDGQKVVVKANHFLTEIGNRDLHHYDVSISPEVTSKKVCREILNQLVTNYKDSHLGKRMLAYDGRKSCYAAGELPFESKDFVVELNSGDSQSRRERKFKVSIKFAAKVDLHHLQQFIQGRQLDLPQETLQLYDVVLRKNTSNSCAVVGRSFFSPMLGDIGELGNGLMYWKDFYQSLRPTQMGLSLNIDMSARAFFEPIWVSEYVKKHINNDLSRGLSDQDRIKVKKALKGVWVETEYLGQIRRHKISGITTMSTQQLMFSLDGMEAQISVAQYFIQQYDINLQYPSLPAIQAGSDTKPIYLPMELCKIVEGQRFSRKLNERQVTALLKATCQRPKDRESSILQMVRKNDYNNDKLVNEQFGIHVRSEMVSIDARVLPPPMLKYHETGRNSLVTPSLGQWNMIDKKMVNGGKVEFWACINFSRMQSNHAGQFCDDLIDMCCSKGMECNRRPLVPVRNARGPIEKALIDLETETSSKTGKQLQLLIVILPEMTGSYGTIKRVCETELGIVSQCCLPKNVSKPGKQYMQYLENVSLKINAKMVRKNDYNNDKLVNDQFGIHVRSEMVSIDARVLPPPMLKYHETGRNSLVTPSEGQWNMIDKAGGLNSVLEFAVKGMFPYLSDPPTIIFGADVTHPQPVEDSSPSIAAVVASTDWPEVTMYRALVSAQAHREEIIQDLYSMVREHLLAFYKSTKLKPHRLIFYRDGVSEGQFSQVLFHEMEAIRNACNSIEENYMPRVTFIVVAANHNDENSTDRSGNILPGTVVDTKICHPTEFDFYLCSHAGIQGTSCPTHYHVLYDDNVFTADGLQMLTNSLCYTYAGCTRSVSLVAPAYYARLAAFRARYNIEGTDFSDSGSASDAGQGATRERN